MSYLAARSLTSAPFIEIYEIKDGVPQQTLELEPPVAGPIEKVKFPRDNSQMAIVTKFRREFMEGIGNPAEVIPSDGLRLIAPNDAYILFGGTSTIEPVLYQRRGPAYMRWGMVIPEEEYVVVAAFSVSSRYLFVVTSDDLTEVKVLRRGGSGFQLIHAIDAGFDVSRIEISSSDEFVIICDADEFIIHDFLDSIEDPFPLVVGTPSGVFLAVSPDGRWYVVNQGGIIKAIEQNDSVWTEVAALIGPPASPTSAKFAPDNLVLAVEGATISFYSVSEGAFEVSGTDAAGRVGVSNYEFSGDGALLLRGAASQVQIFERELLPTNKFFDSGSIVDLSAYTNPQVSLSRNGLFMCALSSSSTFDVYEWNSGTKAFELRGSGAGASGLFDSVKIDDAGQRVIAHSRLFEWDGTEYVVSQIFPATVGFYGYFSWDISPDGNRVALSVRASASPVEDPRLDVFEWNGVAGQFELVRTHGFSLSTTDQIAVLGFSDDSKALAYYRVGIPATNNNLYVRRSEDAFASNKITISNAYASRVVFADDHVIVGDVGTFVRAYRYDVGAGTYGLVNAAVHGLPQDGFGGPLPHGCFFPTLNILALAYDAHPYVRVFTKNAHVYTQEPDFIESVASEVEHIARIGNGRLFLGGDSEIKEHLDPIPVEHRRYTMALLHELEAASMTVDGFSPGGETLHYGNVHRATANLLTVLAEVPFDDEYNASQITNVLWGGTGNFVLYDNPDGPSVSVRTAGTSGYTKAKNLNGLFVAKYERDGAVLRETEYVVHNVDAEITNLVYSKTGLGFSYFLMGDPSETGRYIYDTDEIKLDLKGVDYDARMEASFLAFSPHETHFVVTYQMSDDAHELRLFSLDVNRVYTYEDTELVTFGPVDISACDDVLVAHGGLPDPFTMFLIEDWQFTPQTFPEVDWDHGGFVWDILFTDDCDSLFVLTPDELVSIDLEEGEVKDQSPVDNPPTDSEDGNLDIVDDKEEGEEPGEDESEDHVIRNPDGDGTGGGGGAGGGGGTWQPWPDLGLDNITYYSYSTVHVTYRR